MWVFSSLVINKLHLGYICIIHSFNWLNYFPCLGGFELSFPLHGAGRRDWVSSGTIWPAQRSSNFRAEVSIDRCYHVPTISRPVLEGVAIFVLFCFCFIQNLDRPFTFGNAKAMVVKQENHCQMRTCDKVKLLINTLWALAHEIYLREWGCLRRPRQQRPNS